MVFKIQNSRHKLTRTKTSYTFWYLVESPVIYLRCLLKNMGFAPKKWTPVYEDNNACIEWGNNVIGGRERAKHNDIRKHFAHEAIQNGHLRLV